MRSEVEGGCSLESSLTKEADSGSSVRFFGTASYTLFRLLASAVGRYQRFFTFLLSFFLRLCTAHPSLHPQLLVASYFLQ